MTSGANFGHEGREEPSAADRRRWAVFGLSAIDAGTPDRGLNGDDEDGDLTDAIDTVSNILYWLDQRGCADPLRILASAKRHFTTDMIHDDNGEVVAE